MIRLTSASLLAVRGAPVIAGSDGVWTTMTNALAALLDGPKPTIPQVLPAVVAWVQAPGNSVEYVMHDGNHTDECIRYSIERAEQNGDADLVMINRVLLRMSGTQRGKIRRLMWDAVYPRGER